jgi:hypothetical protein
MSRINEKVDNIKYLVKFERKGDLSSIKNRCVKGQSLMKDGKEYVGVKS